MYECYITFRSITGAQLGSKLLDNVGIYHQMARTPKSLSEKGCGYTLRIRRKMLSQALAALRQGGAPYQKVFCDTETGLQEELVS